MKPSISNALYRAEICDERAAATRDLVLMFERDAESKTVADRIIANAYNEIRRLEAEHDARKAVMYRTAAELAAAIGVE